MKIRKTPEKKAKYINIQIVYCGSPLLADQYAQSYQVLGTWTIAMILKEYLHESRQESPGFWFSVCPELSEALRSGTLRVGIFGRAAALEDLPEEGDRIELYRPLLLDPKKARFERVKAANKQKKMKGA